MYYIGVDIGQALDYTAIAVLSTHQKFREKTSLPGTLQYKHEPTMIINYYQIKHLERMALGTKYQDIVRRVQRITDNVNVARAYYLIVDMTGVGRPVVELMRDANLAPVGVQITSGYHVAEQQYGFSVPKRELVSSLQVLFQSERIKGPKPQIMPEITELKEQLQHFNYKINQKGNEVYQAEKEAIHDDLVLAVALASWYAEKSEGREAIGMLGKKEYDRDDFDPLRWGLI